MQTSYCSYFSSKFQIRNGRTQIDVSVEVLQAEGDVAQQGCQDVYDIPDTCHIAKVGVVLGWEAVTPRD